MEKYKSISIAVFLILNLTAIAFFVYQINYSHSDPSNLSEKVLPAETSNDFYGTYDIKLGNETYTLSYFKVTELDKLVLLPNFTNPKTSNQIMTDKKCSVLTNGGFYLIEKDVTKPIGLFISNYNKISDFQKNKTLNGILSINDFGTPRITRIVPSGNIKDAVQSGPIIKENGGFTHVNLIDDSQNRRTLAAVTGDNSLIFLSIYQKDNTFSGPLIETTEALLTSFELNKNVVFADVINLDGGSASLMYFDSVILPEARLSGSFFCLTN